MNREESSTKKSNTIDWRLRAWFPDLSAETQDKLKKYFIELLKFNKTINLISSKTEAQADLVHFADSILASRVVREKVNKSSDLYDLGSGNGFPGLVYAILYPDQRVVLVDIDERKCEFLKHIGQHLELKNVVVRNIKIEQLDQDSVFQAICRGFSSIPKAALSLRKIVASGGVVYFMKSDEWAIEISQIPSQLCSIWKPDLVSEYRLPAGDKTRLFVVKTEKIA